MWHGKRCNLCQPIIISRLEEPDIGGRTNRSLSLPLSSFLRKGKWLFQNRSKEKNQIQRESFKKKEFVLEVVSLDWMIKNKEHSKVLKFRSRLIRSLHQNFIWKPCRKNKKEENLFLPLSNWGKSWPEIFINLHSRSIFTITNIYIKDSTLHLFYLTFILSVTDITCFRASVLYFDCCFQCRIDPPILQLSWGASKLLKNIAINLWLIQSIETYV